MSAPIRDVFTLEARLTEDLKWRKQEVTTWLVLATRARAHEEPGLLRGGFALLYAHWEGYVKQAGLAYLEYVSLKGLHIGQLRPELAAVSLRERILVLASTKSPQAHSEIIRILRAEASTPAELPFTDATIRTNANLDFATFEAVMHSLGCDASRHAIYRSQVTRLVKARNAIAHGEREYIRLADWTVTRDRVMAILEDLRSQLINSANLATYRA